MLRILDKVVCVCVSTVEFSFSLALRACKRKHCIHQSICVLACDSRSRARECHDSVIVVVKGPIFLLGSPRVHFFLLPLSLYPTSFSNFLLVRTLRAPLFDFVVAMFQFSFKLASSRSCSTAIPCRCSIFLLA